MKIGSDVVIHEGYYVNPETGEVLGHVEAAEEFRVRDMPSAEWVLEKMQMADSEIAAVEMRLAAIQEQMESILADRRRRRNWLQTRFGAELEAFAREALDGAKQRSLKTPFGTMGFRHVAGSIKPLDKKGCIAWAKEYCPAAVVQREELVVSPLKDREDLPNELFDVTPAGDRFYIKTGLE